MLVTVLSTSGDVVWLACHSTKLQRESRNVKRIVLVVPVVLATLLMSGCGASKDDIAKATAAGAAQASQAARASQDAQAAQDAARAKEAKQKADADVKAAADAKEAADAKAAAAVPATSSCGANISVNSTTTCAFAENVASAYRYSNGGTTSVSAWSVVTQQYYSMYCVAGVPVVCRGGTNAVVYIR